MDDPKKPSPVIQSWTQPQGVGGQGFGGQGYGGQGFGGQGYGGQGYGGPGGGGFFPGIGDPFAGPPAYVNPKVVPAGQGGKASFNWGELKGMFDRMGGIDGVIATVGKMQKFVAIMSQMAPFFKLFIGKGSKAATTADNNGRRRSTGGGKRKSGSGSKRRSGTKRK